MTGSSNTAGYCGAFYVERNGCQLVCVTMGEENSQSRFDHVKTELESIFSTYRENKLATKSEAVISDYPLSGACERSCTLVAISDVSILTEQAQKLNCSYNIPEVLTAPISAGDCVGNAVYTDEAGNILATIELTVSEDIKKAGYFDFVRVTALCLTGGM